MLLQVVIHEKSLCIVLTNKKVRALAFKLFRKKNDAKKTVTFKHFQRAVISYWAAIGM